MELLVTILGWGLVLYLFLGGTILTAVLLNNIGISNNRLATFLATIILIGWFLLVYFMALAL